MIALPLMLAVSIVNGPPQRDGNEILARARQVLRAQSYPDPIVYRTTIRVTEAGKDEAEHFHGEAFTDGDVRVAGVSDEEQASPHPSSGVNFKLTLSIGWNTGTGGQMGTMTADAGRIEGSPDYLGIPLISPSYSFGLASGEAAGDAGGAPGAAAGLPTIATVTAFERDYDVTLLGTEAVDGVLAYHLELAPVRLPNRFRIRELWIDAASFRIVQLRSQGDFTSAPMTGVPWLVTFSDIGGCTYIASETALAPLVFPHDRTFTHASIAFDEIGSERFNGLPVLPAMGRSNEDLREPATP